MTLFLIWMLTFPLVEVAVRAAETRLLGVEYNAEERKAAARAFGILYLSVGFTLLIFHVIRLLT